MNRSELVFVTAVFTALVTGFCVERSRSNDALERPFAVPRTIPFESLEPPVGEHRLEGLVRDDHGAPAAEVQVFLYRAEPASAEAEPLLWTYTDREGRFELALVPAGDFVALLSKTGHPNARFDARVPADGPVEWTLAPAHGPIPTMPPIGRAPLQGVLRRPVGLEEVDIPVGGYEIVLRPAAGVDPFSGAVERRATTDAQGFFFFDALAAVRYDVEVLPPWARSGSWPVLDRLAYEHDADRTLLEVLPLRLRSGELTGRVVDPQGRPVEGALVRAWPGDREERGWPPVTTDGAGVFLVRDLPPGRYHLTVQAGAAQQAVSARVGIGRRTEIELAPLEAGPEGPGPRD